MREFNRVLGGLLLAAGAAIVSACGGDNPAGPPPPTPPPPAPAATIQASGNGVFRIHPSVDQRFKVALEAPIRITESTGGTADWHFARLSLFRGGVEVERSELGSDIIAAGGFSRISPRSNVTPTLVFRQNVFDFDSVTITLGFADIKDARQFTVDIPFASFSGIDVSVIPMLVPRDQVRP